MEALVYLLQAFAYLNVAALAFYLGKFATEAALGKFRS